MRFWNFPKRECDAHVHARHTNGLATLPNCDAVGYECLAVFLSLASHAPARHSCGFCSRLQGVAR